MAKINYPESEGLSGVVAAPINDAVQNLTSAKSFCNFSIPTDFAYLEYVNNLYSTINDYQNRANKIANMASSTDKSFRLTFDAMSSSSQALDVSIIDERDRLVK